jgi:uncharacterized protein (TIGR02145 family)
MKSAKSVGQQILIVISIVVLGVVPLKGQLYSVGNGLKDVDGREYGSVIIGEQEWMSENLNTARYRNGQLITNVQDGSVWQNLKTGAWAFYNNDEAIGADFAKLYNWYAVDDARGLCPVGWTVPDNDDWSELIHFLGGSEVAGGKLKATGTEFWVSPNTGASNDSGLNGLPGGYRALSGGVFYTIGLSGIWWSANPNFDVVNPPNDLYERYSNYVVASRDSERLNMDSGLSGRGYSVRCIKDKSATSSDFDLNNWRLPINASIGNVTTVATIGVDPTVTDLNELNKPAPPPPPGNYVRAIFRLSENGELGNQFLSDIRPSVDLEKFALDWTVEITSPIVGELNITLERPVGLNLPITFSDGNLTIINRDGSLSVNLPHDGHKVWIFNIALGDTIAPVILPDSMFEGPAIWDNTLKHNLSWTILEDNYLESVVLEHSDNDGQTWEVLYTGTDSTFEWSIASNDPINELNRFRITATDGMGNSSVYETIEPITTVSRYQNIPYNAGWQMVGAPFITMDSNRSTYNAPYRFKWGYLEYVEDDKYVQGTGYWVGALEAGYDTVYGSIVDSSYTTWVGEGWRLLTVPLLRSVFVDSVTIKNYYSDELVLYSDFINQGKITPPYYFDGQSYVEADKFEPFKAYWIGTLMEYDSYELLFPIHVYPQTTTLERSREVVSNYYAFTVELPNQSQLLKIGTDGVSSRVSPPPIPNGSQIGLISNTTSLGSVYLSEVVESDTETLRQIEITNFSGIYSITWEGNDVHNMAGHIELSNGEILDLSIAGSIQLDTREGLPKIKVKPLVTSIVAPEIPVKVNLSQNYPNPFNPTTSFRYQLPEIGHVTITVHDLLGRLVAVLQDGIVQAGTHTINFDASYLSSGVYIYQLKTEDVILTRKFILLK